MARRMRGVSTARNDAIGVDEQSALTQAYENDGNLGDADPEPLSGPVYRLHLTLKICW